MRGRSVLIGVLVAIGVLVTVLMVGRVLLYKPFRIPSENMKPTLVIGDRIAVRRLGGYTPERGDIVVANPPVGAETLECGEPGFDPAARRQACARPTEEQSKQTFVQRVVAVGGDRLKIEDGRAVVNAKRANEPNITPDETCDICNLPREITIPEDHVFLMGDNRGGSADSRLWGPVREDWIVGPVSFRYWPLDRIARP